MKAYIANDKNGDIYDAIVVFAETRGKARAYAANHEVFDDFTFTDIHVRRCPDLDEYYHGKPEMDWLDMNDRIAMVRHGNFVCTYELSNTELDCNNCGATEYCERYQSIHEEDGDEYGN